MPVDVLGYEHTGILFKDTEAAAEWYRKHFSAVEVSRSDDSPPIIFLSFGKSSLLELVPAKKSPDAEPSDHTHFSFAVPDIEAAVKVLEENGVKKENPVFTAYEGSKVVFFRDLEGNLFQLAERVSPLPLPWMQVSGE